MTGAFVGVGILVSLALLDAMLRGPVTVEMKPWHLQYSTGLQAGLLIVSAYVAATCGSFLFSGIRNLRYFGVVNLIAVGALAAFIISAAKSRYSHVATPPTRSASGEKHTSSRYPVATTANTSGARDQHLDRNSFSAVLGVDRDDHPSHALAAQ